MLKVAQILRGFAPSFSARAAAIGLLKAPDGVVRDAFRRAQRDGDAVRPQRAVAGLFYLPTAWLHLLNRASLNAPSSPLNAESVPTCLTRLRHSAVSSMLAVSDVDLQPEAPQVQTTELPTTLADVVGLAGTAVH